MKYSYRRKDKHNNKQNQDNRIDSVLDADPDSYLNPSINLLKTQFEYSSIASRQCSWFCFQAYDNRRTLLDYYLLNHRQKYRQLYHQCMMNATLNKKNSRDYELIETLFCNNILNKHKLSQNHLTFFKMTLNPCGQDWYSHMSYANTREVLQTKKSFPEMQEQKLIDILHNMKKYDCMMTNRHIMSYLVVKINDISNGHFLLIDSHIEFSCLLTIEEVINYIKYDSKDLSIVTLVLESAFYKRYKNKC